MVGFLVASTAFAGEAEFHATFAVNEEYTDNVLEERDGRKSDFITRLMPGVAWKYKAPVWDWDAAYNLDYRYYAEGTRGDEITHGANVKGKVTLVENLLFLDINDTYRRVSLDVARDRTQESLFANQSDQNILDVSPYFMWRTGTRGVLKTGYRYTNTWYREPEAVDKQAHLGFAEWKVELSQKVTGSVWYNFETADSSLIDYRSHTVGTSLRHQYADGSDISGSFGNRWTHYQDGVNVGAIFWSAGINHKINNLMLRLQSKQSFQEDPLAQAPTKETTHSAGLDAKFDRGAAGLTAAYTRYTRGKGNVVNPVDTLTENRKKYTAGINGRYDMTENLSISSAVTGENFFTNYMFDAPRRIFVDSGISYKKDRYTLALTYRFLDSFSKVEVDENYRVNRVMLEARTSF